MISLTKGSIKKAINLETAKHGFKILQDSCYSSLHKLIFAGFKRPLVDSDLWAFNKRNKSSAIVPPFIKKWKEVESSIR